MFRNHLRLKRSSLLNVYLNCKFEISSLSSYLFFSLFKAMYQKSMKGVIGTHFESKELYLWPNHSSKISIKKVIGNDMERLKIESNEQIYMFFVIFVHKMT